MSPVKISDLTRMIAVKPRKKGVRRAQDVMYDSGIAKIKFNEHYTKGKGGRTSRQGKKFECRWCSRTYIPDGRSVMSCNWHLDYAIHELRRRNKVVPQELWDLVEKIWMYKHELSTKEEST